jgi:hypothetical protein
MNSIRQNISVLSTKVIEITGGTIPKGIDIPLGVPSSGNFSGAVPGWNSSTYVTNAIDQLNKTLLVFSGQSASVSKSMLLFNNTSDWVGPVNGYYFIQYPESLHLKNGNPIYSIQELISGDYYDVKPDHIITSGGGDMFIYVIDDPDGRFSGRIILV